MAVTLVLLKRVDPEEAMDRWYSVTVQPTLFDPLAVICQYGSRRTTWQQIRILPVASPTEAQMLAEEIVAQKLQRGYQLVTDGSAQT